MAGQFQENFLLLTCAFVMDLPSIITRRMSWRRFLAGLRTNGRSPGLSIGSFILLQTEALARRKMQMRKYYPTRHLGGLSSSICNFMLSIADLSKRGSLQFRTTPFNEPIEITGHPTLRVSMSLSSQYGSSPSEIDIFVTLRHIDAQGAEGKDSTLRSSIITSQC